MATCDEKTTTEVGKMIKLGIPPMVAAKGQGISEGEFEEWMRRGLVGGRGEHRYTKFRLEVLKSEATSEQLLVGVVRSAAAAHWQAAVWLLERLYPERYVRRSVSNPDASPGTPGRPDPFADTDNVVPIKEAKTKTS